MNILQRIFTDYYEEIKYTLHPRSTEMENIDKMINCGDGVPASWDWRDWDYEREEKMCSLSKADLRQTARLLRLFLFHQADCMSRHTVTISRKAKLFLCCPFHIDLIHRNIQRLRNVPAHL